MSKWLFILHEHSKQLWFRSSLYCLLAIVTALLGVALNDSVSFPLQSFIKANAVKQILEILAASMLVVATFSLSVMVEALRAASTTATPRATQLLTEDTSAQNALAAFIGAFLFSIVGLLALSAGIYGESGTIILFASTVVVLLLVVIMLLRWVDQLSRLGRVEKSIDLVEAATTDALVKRARVPFLGGHALQEVPQNSFPVNCGAIGYVQYIAMEKLQQIAGQHDMEIYIDVLPGRFCDLVRHIAYTNKPADDTVAAAISEALVIGDTRTFPQDPRFGFVVLGEIAIRALSPAINDPGTAIDVVGTSVRLFRAWAQERCTQPNPCPILYDRVWAPGLREDDFFDDIFSPIARDGAEFREVCIHLQKALRAIGHLQFPPYDDSAKRWSTGVLERCECQLTKDEFAAVEAIRRDWEKAADQ